MAGWLARSAIFSLVLRRLAIVLWIVGSGCTPAPRTQIMATLAAEPGIIAEAQRVRIEISGGNDDSQLEVRHTEDFAIGALPLEVAIIPLGGDPTRRVLVTARALGAADIVIAERSARTGFVRGRTTALRMDLEDACRGVTCGESQTCVSGTCESSLVDPGSLPDYGLDAAVSVPDAPPDTPTTPDAWVVPVRAEGEECDLEAVTSLCAPGTACTCTGPRGCAESAEAPRCWAFRDISCARPIDLSARLAREPSFDVEGDGATAPDVVPGACLAAGHELVYLVRSTTNTFRVNASATTGMEFWYGCAPEMSWGSCTGTWNLEVYTAMPAYLIVEGNGAHTLRITRTSP